MRDPHSGEPATFLFRARDNRGVPGRFDYWQGSGGHVFLGNVPDDLGPHTGVVTVERTSDDELGRILERDGWEHELSRQAFNIPVLRGLWNRLRRNWGLRQRRPGALDGAGFTLIMQRPR